MATLYLIRHGQASFMHDNYDQLSALGWTQARTLGQYLATNAYAFDAVLRGSLARHRDTLAGIAEAYQIQELALPEAQILEGLNEHEGAEIHADHLPQFLEEPENAALRAAITQYGRTHPAVRQGLLRLFFRGTKMWALGELNTPGRETFPEFKQRVTQGFEHISTLLEQYNRIAAITSGGTIGMWLGLILGLSDEKVIELNWQVRNCAITELSYSKGKFYLRGFNHIAHFTDENLITYV